MKITINRKLSIAKLLYSSQTVRKLSISVNEGLSFVKSVNVWSLCFILHPPGTYLKISLLTTLVTEDCEKPCRRAIWQSLLAWFRENWSKIWFVLHVKSTDNSFICVRKLTKLWCDRKYSLNRVSKEIVFSYCVGGKSLWLKICGKFLWLNYCLPDWSTLEMCAHDSFFTMNS